MVTATVREENGKFCVAVALRPGLPVYWPSWLKALAVKLSRPSGQSGSYTGLIGFNPRRLQGPKRGMSSHAMDPSVYAKSSAEAATGGGMGWLWTDHCRQMTDQWRKQLLACVTVKRQHFDTCCHLWCHTRFQQTRCFKRLLFQSIVAVSISCCYGNGLNWYPCYKLRICTTF